MSYGDFKLGKFNDVTYGLKDKYYATRGDAQSAMRYSPTQARSTSF